MSKTDILKVINSRETDDTVHMVIGHAQIHDCWNYKFDREEQNFRLDFICKRNGSPDDFVNIIKEEMEKARAPLKSLQ